SKGEPVAIAGIMGGLNSEIEDDTDSLLLESANFDAVSVRKSSTRIGLRTDASMRYEKTLDPELTSTAIEHFMQLLTEIDPDVQIISSMTDVYVRHYDKIDLSFDKKYVDRYTGIDISNEQILRTLNALGFNASLEGETFTVHVPSWRATKDVTIKADIIEEITRVYGYDNFKITTTKSALAPVLRTVNSNDDRFTKDLLVQRYGLHEVHSYIWCDAKKYKELNIEIEDNVRVINAMTPDHVVLRRSMVPTMISYVNENKAYANEFGIFEIARVVEGLCDDGLCNERKHLGVALYSRVRSEKDVYLGLRDLMASIGMELKHRPFEFRIMESAHNWQHPRNTAGIWLDGVYLGFITVVHPAVQSKIDKKAVIVAGELDMDALSSLSASVIHYDEPSKFPGIDIDLSLVVGSEQTYSALSAAWADITPLLKSVSLIDSYNGAVKSITLRFTFSSMEKTLSKNEVQGYVDTIVENLSKLGVTLR
ncbi:MAG: phenylalanine--tRNA ligase beta subunit-related protein, partial [Ruminococcus bromii]|nr:phenylalanine--tRNA ligase beta subunit-related protein [Ruminococcus bromii]